MGERSSCFVEADDHFLRKLLPMPDAVYVCLNDQVPGGMPPPGSDARDADDAELTIRSSSVRQRGARCHPLEAVVTLYGRWRAAYSSDDEPC